MEGADIEEMRAWREKATAELAKDAIEVRDPTRRVPYFDLYGKEKLMRNISRRVVKLDLQDIAQSNVVLANLDSDHKCWGSVMELAHAHTKNKIIITVNKPGRAVHPFIEFYSTEVYENLDDAIEATKEYYK